MNNNSGLTLIEVAIAMVVLGLIMTPLLAIYSIERKQIVINETYANFRDIEQAIENFVNTHDRYPMPASLTAVEGDAQYGKAFDPTGMNIFPADCSGPTSGGMATDGTCLIVEDDGGGTLAPEEELLIGMVPFADIQIEEDKAYDKWGQRILYVVTARQTQDAASAYGGGTYVRSAPQGIEFNALNTFTQNVLHLAPVTGVTQGYTDFDMLLVSTGPEGKGGFSANGVIVAPCIETANPEYEDENCDFLDNRFMIDSNERQDPRPQGSGGTVNNLAPSREANGTRNLNPGPNFYDDLTHEVDEMQAAIWNENFNSPEIIVTSANRLGIGEQEPETVLHVKGDMRAQDDPATTGVQEGRIIAETISDFSSNDMSPELLGGEVADMNCYQDSTLGDRVRAMVGIGNSQTYCAQTSNLGGNGNMGQVDHNGNIFDAFQFEVGATTGSAPIVYQDCASLPGPSGYRMAGIDAATGQVICRPVP
ncbi:MAG: prepilin-type N-terminal cleavage/methylation domain-containing protein [Alphaproteobacteria bacterium]